MTRIKHIKDNTIPGDWQYKLLPEILDDKCFPPIKIGPFGSQLKKDILSKRGIKVYGQENIFEKSLDVGGRYIDYETFQKLKSCELKSGDFVISMMGTIGQCMVMPHDMHKGIMDSHLIRLKLDHKKILPEYLLQIFSSYMFRNQLKKLSVGGIMEGLSSSIIKQINIVLPPLQEQKAIAAALSDVDSLIECLEQLITKKCDMKTAVMQELLTGKKRLPGFDGEWQEKNMANDSYLKARIGWQGLTTSEYLDAGNYYLVTGTDFKNGKIDWNSCCYVEKERFEQDKNIQVKVNDILLTKDGTIGKAAYVDYLPGQATLNSGVFVIRPVNNNYNPLYFYYVLRSEIFTQFLNQLQAGSTINHLYQKDFVHFSFMAPPVPEQEAIATILYDLDIEINATVDQLNKTKAIKVGMMQDLLTGKTRLIKVDKKKQGVAA